MEKVEAEASSKPNQASFSVEEQTNIHLYPDWVSIQAYYGSGVPFLAPPLNSAAPGHHFPYPYVWAPSQTLISPYGVPYAAVYSHGSVHAHPAVPLAATPLRKKVPSKSSVDMDQGIKKKLKSLDGLAVPVENGGTEDDLGGSVCEVSLSVKHGIDGSTKGSDGNTGEFLSQSNGGSEVVVSTENDESTHGSAGSLSEEAAYAAFQKVSVNNLAPANAAGKFVRHCDRNEETHAVYVASTVDAGLPFAVSAQDEQQIKRERRKQANRDSAKRSRLRKQAENEELLMRYKTLNEENKALKFEISKLTENLDKVKRENTALREKLKKRQQLELPGVEADLILPDGPEEPHTPSNSSAVDQNVSVDYTTQENPNP